MKEQSRHSGHKTYVGKLIQADREQAALSARQYAAVVGVSRPYLSRLEQGLYEQPSPAVLARIAKARGIELADLFVAAGYAVPNELPTIVPCARAHHPRWPDEAFAELAAFYDYLQHKYKLADLED